VNVAATADLAKGTKRVKIGGKSVALASSHLSTSVGDEPGTAGGGLASSKTKGKMTWGSASADVKFEGKGVVRFGDVTQHNGNSFNAAFVAAGGTGFAYGDDFEGLCPICEKDPSSHAVLERPEGSLETANAILADLKACEKAWVAANQRVEQAVAGLKRDLKNAPNMKQATIDARQAAIAALIQARDGLEGHRRADSGGYMFGVLVCLTGKKFAAVSGGETPPMFETIAARHGCTVIKDAATVDDIIAANPMCKVKAGASADAVEAATQAKSRILDRWALAEAKHDKKKPGYNNRPGRCAGAKLIGKSGHVADSMTEIFFSFAGDGRKLEFGVSYRGPSQFAPSSGPWKPPGATEIAAADTGSMDERVDMKRKSGETVPSCRACQDTLFMARCDLERQSCA
jgi:hypothetical protein